ncbi:replication endonuclease [Aeromonas schubertii]|uniref:Replication endonuclease n=1 Tax=Aeromonas schubertii TaxID=652 RepID=A0ABS7V6G7_9GAMM|nr:replication endonuclease [Aeromonas schubertii]MBZ6064681.1 replication endonuclease [Aeromonas schubertii]
MIQRSVYHIGGVNVPRAYLAGHHVQAMGWADRQLSQLEPHVAKPLAKTYLARYAKKPRSAAIWLRNMSAACQQAAERFPVPPHELRNELRRDMVAAEWAGRCKLQLAELTASGPQPAAELLDAIATQAKAWHFCPPLPADPRAHAAKLLARELTDAERASFAPAVEGFESGAAAILVRLLDEAWWRRRINRAWDVYCELIAIFTGQVRKGVSPYASNNARREHMGRKQAQLRWAEGRQVINDELGQECDLLDAMMASVSNPMIRRCELMVRMRGFEELAKEAGHTGLFVTLTAPSQFHAWKQNKKNGRTYQNDKYNGSTPTQTQRLLCEQWAKFRAAIARRGLKTYGFRIAEPHHDATPHWHALLFVEPERAHEFLALLTFYFTAADRHELGMPNTPELDYLTHAKVRNKAAKALALIDVTNKATVRAIKPRVAWEVIDESKGSATGYIAKYVSKNIDGHRVGWDEEAEEAVESSTVGVAAWASRHRIRQFQQVGGPAVTVWRELRRLGADVVEWDAILETARAAVNGSRWGDFIKAMGGLMAPRSEHLIQLSKRLDEGANKYGEDVLRLMGVMSLERQQLAQTRHEGWEIVKKGTRSTAGQGAVVGERSELQSSGGSRAPRSSVNNCTQGSKSAEKGSALASGLSRMGLSSDAVTVRLLERGSILEVGGQFLRLVGDRLILSRAWPGAARAPEHCSGEMVDPVTAQIERELATEQAQREQAVRDHVRRALFRGEDITAWLGELPLPLAELAVAELRQRVERIEAAAHYEPTEQEIARCETLHSSNHRHRHTIAAALAERGVE